MNKEETLFNRCHINTNKDGDRFVGVRVNEGKPEVCFPPGYECPDNESSLRMDIVHLLSILETLGKGSTSECRSKIFSNEYSERISIAPYLEIIQRFLENQKYYQERECVFKVREKGKIDWKRTFHHQYAIFDGETTPIYLQFVTRNNPFTEANLISHIHKFVVYESFVKFGWLFTAMVPDKPELVYNKQMFSSIIHNKLSTTYNDNDKKLFTNMLAVINQYSPEENKKQFLYGTDNFDFVWELLIDKAFGIRDKKTYYPKTNWHFCTPQDEKGYLPDPDMDNAALRPDTIMTVDNKFFVLDAKYYKYGFSTGVGLLPTSADINKQITYGEHIHYLLYSMLNGNEIPPIYNAFILPYNASKNRFGRNGYIEVFGLATGSWKTNKKNHNFYEYVLGILLDVRYLINHFSSQKSDMQKQMANAIVTGVTREINSGL